MIRKEIIKQSLNSLLIFIVSFLLESYKFIMT
jgi:hypothetical protein